MDKKNKSYITIPYLVIANLPNDKRYFKMITVYYQLKGLHNCGCIKDYRKRYQEISKKLGIGESTLRLYISELKKANLIEIRGKNLFIKNKYELVKYCGFDVEAHVSHLKRKKERILRMKSRTIRFQKKDLYKKNGLIDFLYALKIYHNIEHKQKSAYIDKVVKGRLSVSDKYSTANIKGKDKLFFEEKRNVHHECGFLAMKERLSVQSIIKTGKIINQDHRTDMFDLADVMLRKADFTLSRAGVARILGRKSSTWGSSMMETLKNKGYIKKDETNVIAFRIPANSSIKFINSKMELLANRIKKYYKGCVIYFCKYTSNIIFKQSNTIKTIDELFFKHYIYNNNINPTIVKEIF